MSRRLLSTEQRFWSHVEISGINDCWIWKLKPDIWGYGVFCLDSKRIKAHRYSYVLKFGNIPEGMKVCHKCDNPICVNPNHLFLGTNSDNMLDMFAKGRGFNVGFTRGHKRTIGSKNAKAKLSEDQIREIRINYQAITPITRDEIASKYNVDPKTIYDILSRRTWKHV